MGLIPTIVVT